MSDLIGRHGVVAWLDNMGYPKLANIVNDKKRFPSAEPERKIGKWMQAVGMKPVIHAYYLKSDNVHICTKEDVLDADITHEMWVLDKPYDWHRVDYEITACVMTDEKDQFGKDVAVIHAVDIKRVPYKDNLKNLIEGLGLEYDEFMNRFSYLTFRELAMNIGNTDELRERRIKHLHHKNFESLQKRVKAYKEGK